MLSPLVCLYVCGVYARTYVWIYLCTYLHTGCPEGECARLRENVPYVKVHRYNPKHLYPKSNGYGDNGERSLKV